MKKKYLSVIIILALISNLNAQISLTYDRHALRVDEKVKTYITSFVDDDKTGPNQVWDFSKLTLTSPHEAEVVAPYETPNMLDFPRANTVIKESGNYFYFFIDQFTNECLGWVNKSAVIKLDKPSRKMVYPFKYGDKFSGDYLGHTVVSKLYGHYETIADGYGTLKLPNNQVIPNVLRVKVVDQLVEEACNSVGVVTTKYLYYSEDYRFPLLIVFKRTENYSGNDKPKEFQYCVMADHLNIPAASLSNQNTQNIEQKPDYKVFPNPYTDFVKIEYLLKTNAKVYIDVFNVTGSRVASIVAGEEQKAENYTYTFKPSNYGLQPATYIIKLRLGSFQFEEAIIGVDK